MDIDNSEKPDAQMVGFKISKKHRDKLDKLRIKKSEVQGYHCSIQQFFVELLDSIDIK